MGEIGPTSYEQTNMMFDAGAPKGALNYWKSSFLAELNDTAIDIIVQQFGGCPPSLGGIFIEHFHGAATRVGETDTAFPQRTPGYNFLAVAAWLDPTQTKEQVAWARETYAAMQPHLASVRYVNYLDADEGEDPAAGAYGPNYKRLRSLKSKYDPANLFRMNQNIKPS
jgi:FAD/FMN-containing dehydrogenase